jgi:hypothetical protein
MMKKNKSTSLSWASAARWVAALTLLAVLALVPVYLAHPLAIAAGGARAVAATAIWAVCFIGVALWRFVREEF